MPVSEEMVEIGAKAMHARLRKQAWPDDGGGGSWDPEAGTYQIPEDAKERYRASARACLTAALSDQVVGWPKCTHHIDGDDGPTCGYDFEVDDKRHIWCGEISDRMYDENNLAEGGIGGNFGFFIVMYDETKPQGQQATIIAKATDQESAETAGRFLALGYRSAPPQPSEDNGPDTKPHQD